MSSKLVEHLSRCSTNSLIPLLGGATITLLENVGNDALTPEGLAYLVVSTLGERGTLRNRSVRELLFSNLEKAEGTALCVLLRLPNYAPLMTLKSADFDHSVFNIEMLMRWFDVSEEAEDDSARENEGSRKAIASHKLRSHQIVAYRKLRHVITDPTASALVHMPFGAGKLRLVATAVLDLYRSEPDGGVIVWLAPGEALCDEAFTELRQVWEQLGSRDVTIFRLYGKRPSPDLDTLTDCIVIADITTLGENRSGLAELGQKTRVVVLGDAELIGHSLGADVVRKMSEGGEFNVVGISASPGSVIDESPSREAMGAKFSTSCIYIESKDPISELREGGDVDEIVVEITTVQSSGISVNDDSFDLSFEDAEVLSKDVSRNKALLELLLRESKMPGKIAFYTTTSEHARLFAGLLALRGVRAMAVTNQMSADQRALTIEKFNARDDKILCVHGFFISGGAVPDLTVGVIAAPTFSEAVFHEMVGRLASDRGAGKKPLRIVVIDDSISRHKRLITSLGTWNELKI